VAASYSTHFLPAKRRDWRADKPRAIALIVSLLALGVLVRLFGITRSLWLDEFGTLWVVESGLHETFRRALTFQGQSPFYYAIAWFSIHSFGESELALRLPSVVASAATAAITAATAQLIGPRGAAAFTAIAVWLSFAVVQASVNARPYALAMFATAAMLYGFTRAAIRGDTLSRVIFVAGTVALIWSHYVLSLAVPGLALGYVLLPDLRVRYPMRSFTLDFAVVAALTSLTFPQVIDLWHRRSGLSWIQEPQHGAILGLVAPFLVGALGARTENLDQTRRSLRTALWIGVVVQIGFVEFAALSGLTLVASRYLSVIVIPVAILGGTAVARLPRRERAAPVVCFVGLTAYAYGSAFITVGTFSGAGPEDWRRTVAAMRKAAGDDRETLVLYRSGFVEQDAAPAVLKDVDRAPLRSPGQSTPNWTVVPLTYRWSAPRRAEYFKAVVGHAVRIADRFYLLALPFAEPGVGSYSVLVERWVAAEWPGRFEARRVVAGNGLEVVEYIRVAGDAHAAPSPRQ